MQNEVWRKFSVFASGKKSIIRKGGNTNILWYYLILIVKRHKEIVDFFASKTIAENCKKANLYKN